MLSNSFENFESSYEEEILPPSDVESLPASASSLRNLVPTEEPFQSTQSCTRSFSDEGNLTNWSNEFESMLCPDQPGENKIKSRF